VSIFIVAESEKALVTRLAGRGTEHPTELLMRVQTAKDELARAAEFDFGAHPLRSPLSTLCRPAERARPRLSQPGEDAAA
jgi:hypothetical protein